MTKSQFDLQPGLENHLLILKPLKDEGFENLYKVAYVPAGSFYRKNFQILLSQAKDPAETRSVISAEYFDKLNTATTA